MKFAELIETKIFPLIKKAVPGITKITVPGLVGIWFNVPGESPSIVVTETSDGCFRLSCSVQNIYVGNDNVIVEHPEDIVDVIAERYAEWHQIPVVGRTTSRAAELELELGTLTGINVADLVSDENQEDVVFDDAVTEIPDRVITL